MQGARERNHGCSSREQWSLQEDGWLEQPTLIERFQSFCLVFDNIPMLSKKAGLQPEDVANHVLFAVPVNDVNLWFQCQKFCDEIHKSGLVILACWIVLNVVVTHEAVDLAGISFDEDMVIKFLHQSLIGRRFNLAHLAWPLSRLFASRHRHDRGL